MEQAICFQVCFVVVFFFTHTHTLPNGWFLFVYIVIFLPLDFFLLPQIFGQRKTNGTTQFFEHLEIIPVF